MRSYTIGMVPVLAVPNAVYSRGPMATLPRDLPELSDADFFSTFTGGDCSPAAVARAMATHSWLVVFANVWWLAQGVVSSRSFAVLISVSTSRGATWLKPSA